MDFDALQQFESSSIFPSYVPQKCFGSKDEVAAHRARCANLDECELKLVTIMDSIVVTKNHAVHVITCTSKKMLFSISGAIYAELWVDLGLDWSPYHRKRRWRNEIHYFDTLNCC